MVKFTTASVHSFSVRSPTCYLCQQRLVVMYIHSVHHRQEVRLRWFFKNPPLMEVAGGQLNWQYHPSCKCSVCSCTCVHTSLGSSGDGRKGTKGVLLWNCNWVKMQLSACLSVLMSPISPHLINIKYVQESMSVNSYINWYPLFFHSFSSSYPRSLIEIIEIFISLRVDRRRLACQDQSNKVKL